MRRRENKRECGEEERVPDELQQMKGDKLISMDRC